VQRRELVVDLDLDVGLVVVGQLDVGDLADRQAADLDLVPLDQLVRRRQVENVLGAAAHAEDEHGDGDHRSDQRPERGSSRDRHARGTPNKSGLRT
jgi:hypothetical protein